MAGSAADSKVEYNKVAGEDLIIATMEQEVDDARAALKAGADPNYTNDFGITPLHVACGGTGPPEMLQLLLYHGAIATTTDSTGWFPLVYAASSGQTKLVRVLLEAGGPDGSRVGLNYSTAIPDKEKGVDSDTPKAWTPLSRAAYRGNLETVLALLAAGAAPDLRASRGEAEAEDRASASASGGRAVESPPAELARGAGHEEVAEAIEAAMGEPSSASAIEAAMGEPSSASAIEAAMGDRSSAPAIEAAMGEPSSASASGGHHGAVGGGASA